MANPPIRVRLQTVGRKTGQTHTVKITAVLHNGGYYFTRHRPDSDWFLNALHNPGVVIYFDHNRTVHGTAEQIHDASLTSLISGLKYPNDPRAEERRVAIKVTPISDIT